MTDEPAKKGWFSRLSDGFKKSSQKLSEGISSLILDRKLDQDTLDELEELLITADIGINSSRDIIKKLSQSRFNQEISSDEIKQFLATDIAARMQPYAVPLDTKAAQPLIVLIVGVNGAGKTTTIGKLAHYYKHQGLKVAVAACDTFRAAAVDQLKEWTTRADVKLITGQLEQDPASLAFSAVEMARAENYDILFIDTAGRLQNKQNLMDELKKIQRVIQKVIPEAPHATLLVLDATVGQNAHQQVDLFNQVTKLDGLIMTKLDGTAKGGILIALTEKFKLPIVAIGIGEKIDDLRPFTAESYGKSLTNSHNL